MADDRHYVPGDNYILDDISGFKIRAARSRRIPGGNTGGAQVDISRWEAQQPQDFVRGVTDNQNAAIVRPRQTNRFMVVGTWVTEPSAFQAMSITVEDATGFAAGNAVQVMLDTGDNLITVLTGVSGRTLNLYKPLPGSVGGSYGNPIENMVLRRSDLDPPVLFVLDEVGQNILGFNVLG